MRFSASLLALVLLSGCGLLESGLDRPRRVDLANTTLSETPDGLAEARARWNAAGASTYRIEYSQACECTLDQSGPFILSLLEENITTVERTDGDSVREGYVPFTIERLFAAIDEAFANDAASVRVRYDDALGFPVEVAIDYDAMIADEELFVTVTGFERL